MLRKRYPDAAYVGIELEVNQRFVEQGGAAWDALRGDLVESLAAALATEPLRREAMTLTRARRHHCSGGNSWKTLRVPATHCCLSDSK